MVMATHEFWVVYLMTIHGKSDRMSAVCTQSEWDAMELSKPGYQTLVRSGIASETEAEKLARDSSGWVPAPSPRLKPR